MRVRHFFLFALAGAVVLPGLSHAQQDRAVPVEASVIKASPLEITVTAAAALAADEAVVIRPQIDGRVVEIAFEEGSRVEKGDLLFRLDDGLLRAQRAEAEAALDLANQNAERAKMLFTQGAGTERVRDESEAQVKTARARAAMARERLAYTRITAPFGGLIGFRNISVGAYVKSGDDLVELVAIDPMKVSFDVPERYLSAVSVGQKVEVVVDALAGESFTGELVTISPRVTAAGRSLKLRAQVGNADGRLRPGLFARANLRIAERGSALMVPESAIVPQGEKRLVYRVVGGKARIAEVKLGIRRAGKVEVSGGISDGDIVVTAGQLKLRDGVPVAIVGGDAVGRGGTTVSSDEQPVAQRGSGS